MKARLPGAATLIVYVASITSALALSAVLVSITGGSAARVFSALIDGSLQSPGAWGRTLTTMAPLLLVAAGTMVSSRAGQVNIGQEGQVLLGAAFAAYLAVRIPGGRAFGLTGTLLFAGVGGAAWVGIAAALKVWRGIPEVLSTLLLAFIAFPLTVYGLNFNWLLGDRSARINHVNTGEELPASMQLPDLDVAHNRVDASLLLAAGVAVLLAFVLGRTVLGLRLTMLGLNPRAAQRFGVNAHVAGTHAMLVSGFLAGTAGGVLLTGGAASNRFSAGFSNNFGWDGLLVALLARSKPLLAIPMAFVFASLRMGSSFLAATGVDRRITDVVQALLVLALLFPPALLAMRDRRRTLAQAQERV